MATFLGGSWASAAELLPPPADPQVIHVLNRLSYGPRPGDIERVQEMGIDAYVETQLHPERLPLPNSLVQTLDKLPALSASPLDFLQSSYPQDSYPVPPGAQERTASAEADSASARYLRAISSPRQLEEVLVTFWFNHFNVFTKFGNVGGWVASYEQTAIRPYIWGNFREMLAATAKHPAMLMYLDNWLNTAPNSPGWHGQFSGLNENYAREVMELHTLGVDGGYTEGDVDTLARIFTGWGILRAARTNPRHQRAIDAYIRSGGDPFGDCQSLSSYPGFLFDRTRHDASDKVFLGIPISGGGMEEGERALDILASHPATARHISYKLAQYFVADDPPETLVERLAQRFLQTDGNLTEVVSELVRSPEFWNPQYFGSKFKTPYDYVISVLRAAGASPNQPIRDFDDRTISTWLNLMGMPLYGSHLPTGYSNRQTSWLNSDAMVKRASLASAVGGRVSAAAVGQSIGPMLTTETRSTIARHPPAWRAHLMLGSPEMIYR